jgi:hypothetical protein
MQLEQFSFEGQLVLSFLNGLHSKVDIYKPENLKGQLRGHNDTPFGQPRSRKFFFRREGLDVRRGDGVAFSLFFKKTLQTRLTRDLNSSPSKLHSRNEEQLKNQLEKELCSGRTLLITSKVVSYYVSKSPADRNAVLA